MKMVQVKTAELEGKALDYAVQLAMLLKRGMQMGHAVQDSAASWAKSGDRAYSSDWYVTGPLIDEYEIEFVKQAGGAIGAYAEFNYCPYEDPCGAGSTHLIAACRAIVVAELGDEVEVPEGLL